jgi:beta-barrel assembly-enhancing protease
MTRRSGLVISSVMLLWSAVSVAPAGAQPRPQELEGEFRRAISLNRGVEAAETLTRIADTWPHMMNRYGGDMINTLVTEMLGASARHDKVRHALIERLVALNWKEDYGVQPSRICLELARIRLQQNDLEKARALLPCIHRPYDVMALRVDKRFTPLIAGAAIPDVVEAAQNEVQQRKQIAKAEPRRSDAMLRLVQAQLTAGELKDALSTLDDALSKVEKATWPAVYDDSLGVHWIYHYRAITLVSLGDIKGATAAMRSTVPDIRPDSVLENRINLADHFIALEQPNRALQTLEGIRPKNDYQQWVNVRINQSLLNIAMLKGDDKMARDALSFLKGARDEHAHAFQLAQMWMDEDKAAKFLIERLNDPVRRIDALVSVQQYDESHLGASGIIKERLKWKALVAREDVQAAIAKVGTVERFALPPPR